MVFETIRQQIMIQTIFDMNFLEIIKVPLNDPVTYILNHSITINQILL